MNRIVTTEQICGFLSNKNFSFRLIGNEHNQINDYATLNQLSNRKFIWVKKWTENIWDQISNYNNLIIVCPEFSKSCLCIDNDHSYIQCKDPKLIFFEALGEFFQKDQRKTAISSTAIIRTEKIGKECVIGDYTSISSEASIGDFVEIGNHVSIIGKVIIGNHCKIKSGAVIGEVGFGYYKTLDGHFKQVPHMGGVVIDDYVEIGANTCIDRGTMGDTEIGKYTKIDNLVHIAHNVHIGQDVLIIAGVVLGGSSQIQDGAYIAPGAIVRNQIKVAEDSFVGMQACVVKDTEAGKTFVGVPAKPIDYS